MKNLKTLSLFFIALFFLNLSCSKDDDSVKEEEEQEQEPSNFKFTDIKVILPEGSNLDLASTKIYSQSIVNPVAANGSSKIIMYEEDTELSFLFDKDDNLLFAGFINSENNEMSIETTTEFLLYMGLGTFFKPNEVKQKFITEVKSVPGFSEFSAKMTELFLADPLMVSKGSYIELLKEKITELTTKVKIDIRANKIDLNKTDIRSGIGLDEVDFQSFKIINSYRRRAHAFLYKTAFKNEAGSETIIDVDISGGDTSDFDIAVSPVIAANSVQGIIGSYNSDFTQFETEPIPLALQPAESEATYKVRVVGPAKENTLASKFTEAEKSKLKRLQLETFVLDWFLPLVSTGIGKGKNLLKSDREAQKGIVTFMESFIESVPTLYDSIQKEDYDIALTDFMYSFYSNVGKNNLKEILIGIFTRLGNNTNTNHIAENSDVIGQYIDKTEVILEVFNKILTVIDYALILSDRKESKQLEEWVVKAKQGTVSLTPERTTTIVGKLTDFEAKTDTQPTDGGILQYKWTTTGKYGIIRDNNPNNPQEGTSFTTSQSKISYISNLTSGQLSGEENIDEVTVVVSVKKGVTTTKIGDATATVNVKRFGYSIVPDGATISGGTVLTFHLDRNDGVPLADNDAYEHKVIWRTSGTYGKFNGAQNQVTQERNGNYNIDYDALDKTVRMGTETVTALIYSKQLSDSQYALVDEITATINIDNDPKKKYLVLEDVFYIEKFADEPCLNNPASIRNWLHNSFFVNKIEGAISYSLRCPSVKDGDGAEYGARSWNWNNNSTQYGNDGVDRTDENGDSITIAGDFELYIYGGAINTCNTSYGETVARLAATQAIGYLTVTLE